MANPLATRTDAAGTRQAESNQAAAARLTLRLFGPFRVWFGERSVTDQCAPRDCALLALLALSSGRPVDREWLAATLWPDSEPSNARYYLRRGLTALRRALGPHAGRLESPTPRSLHLDLEGADCDLLDFNAAVAHQDGSSLQAAVALYTAPLLQGNQDPWCEPVRRQTDEAVQQALWVLAGNALENDEPAEAVRRLRQLLELDPLQERALRLLLQALARIGDYAAMIQAYRAFRLMLHEDLTASPDAETTALYQKLQEQARHAPASRSLASKRVPESIVRLPHPVTPLVGRQEEIRELEALLKSHRLLTLTGTGGVGKTRLAIAAARTQAGVFRDGIWFVDLDSLRDAGLLVHAVAQALEVAEPAGETSAEQLIPHLRSRCLLLVMDNCEHLLEACGELVRLLLEACGELKVLATSRQSLGLPGEVCRPVCSLASPEPQALRDQGKSLAAVVAEYEAVELFVQRARQAHPEFRLTSHNAAAVASICRRLDGIPLAIELAAAKVRALPVEQIVRQLDDRFAILQGTGGTMPPRQRTLNALVDWSWDLLQEAEKTLLSRLAVFAGGWTLEAAEAVCSDAPQSSLTPDPATEQNSAAAELIHRHTALVDKSLIMVETWSGQMRYRLLETIGQYASDRLAERGETEALRRRHCAYFVALTENASSRVQGADSGVWIARYEAERDNLRAAIAWSLAREVADYSLQLTGNLHALWWYRAQGGERQELFALPDVEGDGRAPMVALDTAWWLAFVEGDRESARRYCSELAARARLAKDDFYLAIALNGHGILAEQFDYDFQAAHAYYEESLKLYRKQPDAGRSHAVLANLGGNACARGDYAGAQAYLAEALEISERKDNQRNMAACLCELGVVFQDNEEHDQACAWYERAIEFGRAHGFQNWEVLARISMVELLLDRGDAAGARRLFEQTPELRDPAGDPRSGALYGRALAELGETVAAREVLTQALRSLLPRQQSLDVVTMVGCCLEGLCVLSLMERDTPRAVALLAIARTMREAHNRFTPPRIRALWRRLEAPLRQTLGNDAFAAAYALGCNMTRTEALAYALEDPI